MTNQFAAEQLAEKNRTSIANMPLATTQDFVNQCERLNANKPDIISTLISNETCRVDEQMILSSYTQLCGYFPVNDFLIAWEQQGRKGGAEHKVALLNDGKTVRKLGGLITDSNWWEKIQRFELHNQVFSGTPYSFRGYSEVNKVVHYVVDQQFIIGESIVNAPISAIKRYMRANNYRIYLPRKCLGLPKEVSAIHQVFINHFQAIAVWELHANNVLYHQQRDELYFIDPQIKRIYNQSCFESLIELTS